MLRLQKFCLTKELVCASFITYEEIMMHSKDSLPSIGSLLLRRCGLTKASWFICLHVILLVTFIRPCHASLSWQVTLMERAQGESGDLNDDLIIGSYTDSSDGLDINDVEEVAPPNYYVSFAAFVMDSPNYLAQDMKSPAPTGDPLVHRYDIRVRTDQFDALTLNISWDPAYGYDFSGLSSQGLTMAQLLLIDEGTGDGGYVAQYNLLVAGGFSIDKAFGEDGTIRYMHIDLQVIPEPSVVALAGLGLGLVLARVKRIRN